MKDVYDIEQSTSKRRRRTIKSKNIKNSEKINNIDIIVDIDKVTKRFDENNEINEFNDKDILSPLSPISITSDNTEPIIEIISTKEKLITINDDTNLPYSNYDTTIVNHNDYNNNNNENNNDDDNNDNNNNNNNDNNNDNNNNNDDDDDDDVEIIGEKYIKYSSQPTVFETFTKNKILWCHYCGSTHTSNWRHGPWGKKSLCNKHGCDYKGYGFSVKRPRLNLSKFTKETSKRIRPVIQEYCCVCFSDNSTKDNVLVMCNGCYRAYHQNCYPDKISSDIVNSTDLFYCKEECKHTREKKKIETNLPKKNLPLMLNSRVSSLKSKTLDTKSVENMTPAPTPAPNSPDNKNTPITTDIQEPLQLIEPEPKILKAGINIEKSSLELIKKQRQLQRKRGEDDKVIYHTKHLSPIVGFKHNEIPLPTWEIRNENKIDISSNKRKRKNYKKEMLEDISDEAYIKRHYPLELSEKCSRCGSLINTSKIDEEALNKMIEKQAKQKKLKKGYIYI
ncbi:hypothetical protein U3516DRAFT_558666 [Neocallimastix sp. 'constans']